MKKPIRIGIVDDHPGVRIAVRNLLATAQDITVVGEAGDGMEAIRLADVQEPDVLLLDVELPILRGNEVVKRIKDKNPDVKVLALSSYDDPMYILSMLENGAAGYITKDEAPHLLIVAVRSIMDDEVKWISPKVANQVSKITLENRTFTGRELEILRLIVLGTNDEEIMHALVINEKLFKRYMDILMDKFDVSSHDELKDAAQSVLSTTSA